MNWNNWFSDSEEASKGLHKTKFDETLEQFNKENWVLHKVPEDWVPYAYSDNQELLEQIRDFFPETLNEVDSSWNYWPTVEEKALESIRCFDISDLKYTEPVKRVFFERFKNTLDLSVISERIKNVGFDPGYSITDTEYTNALNRTVDKKWRENFSGVYRLNIGLMTIAVIMSTVSNQPGFYWGVFVTGAFNLWKSVNSTPSKIE